MRAVVAAVLAVDADAAEVEDARDDRSDVDVVDAAAGVATETSCPPDVGKMAVAPAGSAGNVTPAAPEAAAAVDGAVMKDVAERALDAPVRPVVLT
jgi:hypothetical protein